MTTVKIYSEYDPVLKRYRVRCPKCGHVAVRAKREAALHVMAQHVAYEGDEVEYVERVSNDQ
jgi:ribosomal protein S27AE